MSDFSSIEDLIKRTNAKAEDDSAQQTAVRRFDEAFGHVRVKEKEAEVQIMAKQLGIPYVNLQGFPISPEALSLFSKEQAEKIQAVAFLFTGTELRLGAVRPKEETVQELLFQLTERNKTHGVVYAISEESLRAGLKAYETLPKIRQFVKGVKVTDEELKKFQSAMETYRDIEIALQSASITDVVTIILAAALKFGSSDIHVEAEQKKIVVRYRVDGVLQDVASLPGEFWKKVVARIKLVSGLKINVNDKPQDGRFTIFLAEGDTDVRVSLIPTSWGESVVMRILKPASINVAFSALGWRPVMEKKLLHEIEKPHGMLMTTGPTGSGKTTTLYAVLKKLNSPGVKIITLEDPIEYHLENVTQSQVNDKRGYTFGGGLRAILRQDPDIIMIGEIRDMETAETAAQAALTGHVLLSTLHTNSAVETIPRLINIGLQPYMIAPAIHTIIAQRLIRVLCKNCSIKKQITESEKDEIAKVAASIKSVAPDTQVDIPSELYQSVGCPKCSHTGYSGQTCIAEVFAFDDEIKDLILGNKSTHEIFEAARRKGMLTLKEDGVLKVIQGVTTLNEVYRIVE